MTDHIPFTSPDPELQDRPKKGLAGGLFAPVAGYGVTISSIFREPVTEQHPEERIPTAPRYHGRHQFNRYPDGLECYIGCEFCTRACPTDAIFVEATNNTPDSQVSPGERYGRVYQISYLRCILYGFCTQACPTKMLTMTSEYELAGPTQKDLVYEKEDLLAPILEGMLAAPHSMAECAFGTDYYRGEVVGPTTAQIEWVAEYRPDDLTLATAVSVNTPGPFDVATVSVGAPAGSAAVPAGTSGGEHTKGGR